MAEGEKEMGTGEREGIGQGRETEVPAILIEENRVPSPVVKTAKSSGKDSFGK